MDKGFLLIEEHQQFTSTQPVAILIIMDKGFLPELKNLSEQQEFESQSLL